ncbi:hypothetical protein JOE23_000921 [Amphibacillus cookii]|nr:hypothetical protein [Amphibacillus cookii]
MNLITIHSVLKRTNIAIKFIFVRKLYEAKHIDTLAKSINALARGNLISKEMVIKSILASR